MNVRKFFFLSAALVTLLGSVFFVAPAVYAQEGDNQTLDCSLCDPRMYSTFHLPGTDSKPQYGGLCTNKLREYCERGLLPFCARTKLGCTSIGDIALAAINYGRFIFGISGVVALVFVMYGGALMMFSFGNTDRMKQGKSALVAAAIGLVIIFSAYAIVSLLINSLDVASVAGIDTIPL